MAERGPRKTYTDAEKAEVLAALNTKTIQQVSEQFGVSISSIQNWKKASEENTGDTPAPIRKPRASTELEQLKDALFQVAIKDPEIRQMVIDAYMAKLKGGDNFPPEF